MEHQRCPSAIHQWFSRGGFLKKLIPLVLTAFVLGPVPAQPASQHLQMVIQECLPQLQQLAGEEALIQDVVSRNSVPLSPEQTQKIQDEWIQIGISSLAKSYLHNASSMLIRRYEPKIPLMIRCFVLDCRGNVVGAAPQSKDFAHASQDKFRKCYDQGRVYVNPPQLDPYSQIYSVQVSVPVMNQGRTIGVLIATLSLE